jgi:hypothetical protein
LNFEAVIVPKLKITNTASEVQFLGLTGHSVANPSYHNILRNYFQDVSKMYKVKKIKKRRIINIHNSFLSNLRITDKKTNLVGLPRNPFMKDELIMDYDMDSEEELQEENAEDIKSNENSIDEDDDVEEEEEKWIVPDGHFSTDELSQIEPPEMDGKKINGIMEIMEIRKNYPKHIHISLADKATDAKVRQLADQLRAVAFANHSFPIVLSDKKFEEKKKTGLNPFIEDRLDDVVREIHGSYMSKDAIIKSINEKYSKISKAALSDFFKENALKTTDTPGKVCM